MEPYFDISSTEWRMVFISTHCSPRYTANFVEVDPGLTARMGMSFMAPEV